ncbi:hypothetical protein PFISCL1PPCAC_11821, partial [Pristionchus fissidentatus]
LQTLTGMWLVYLYHLAIIVITMMRSRTKEKLQFSLYLFDLMPQENDRSLEEDDAEENYRMEESARTKTGGASGGLSEISEISKR